MRRGSVFRRCGTCRKKVTERTCPCGGGRGTWTWVVDLAAPGGPRQQAMGVAPTKEAAIAAMADAQQKKTQGTWVRSAKTTVGQYLGDRDAGRGWIGELTGVRPLTHDQWERIVRLHLAPRIGEVRLQALDLPMVRRLYQALAAAGLGPRTVFNVHVCLRRALADAVADGLIGVNPASGALRRSREQQEIAFWTGEEAARFLHLARDRTAHDQVLYQVALQTGMRRGELLGLRWRDVDLGRRRLTIEQQIVAPHGVGPTTGPPKTRGGRRTIDLAPETAAALETHWAAQPDGQALVFCRPDGRPHGPTAITSRFDRAVNSARRKDPTLPRITFHGLRHSSAVIGMRELGEWSDECSARLGHASVAFTLETYGHLLPKRGRQVAEGFGRILLVPPERWGRKTEAGDGQ